MRQLRSLNRPNVLGRELRQLIALEPEEQLVRERHPTKLRVEGEEPFVVTTDSPIDASIAAIDCEVCYFT